MKNKGAIKRTSPIGSLTLWQPFYNAAFNTLYKNSNSLKNQIAAFARVLYSYSLARPLVQHLQV